jgi:phosphoserine phosphatase RsbU/P
VSERLELLFDLGPGAIQPQEGDIRALCRSAVANVQLDHPERWISHRLHRARDCAGFWDNDQIFQLITTLLEHAVRRGARNAPVSLDWHGTEDEVVVEIEYEPRTSDAGSSIGPDDAELALGPLVATAIAHAHGGTTELARTAWGGLRWAVRLPREAGPRALGYGAHAVEARS